MLLSIEVDYLPTNKEIISYLNKTGWTYLKHKYNLYIYIINGNYNTAIYIPDKNDFQNRETRIKELLNKVSIIENTDSYKVYKNIIRNARDELISI